MITGLQPAELPHSEMSGSQVVCTYPNLIAAYHVLHRLLEPRHPPFALSFFFYVKLFVVSTTTNPNLLFTLWTIVFLLVNNYKIKTLFKFLSWIIAFTLSIRQRSKSFRTGFNLKLHPRWRITDSNRWPPACKAGALASWANPPVTLCVKSKSLRV